MLKVNENVENGEKRQKTHSIRKSQIVWCQMVAIVYKTECLHKMNIICTISSNYLNLVEPKRRFEYLVFVWIQCIICLAECVVIYGRPYVYMCIWQSKASDEYTTHSASVCVSVLVTNSMIITLYVL